MKWLLPLVFAFVAPLAYCTEQIPDKIILAGQEMPLFTTPLEHLWLDDFGRPVFPGPALSELPDTPIGRQLQEVLIRRRPEVLRREGVSSTANHRGYVATWRIEIGRLWLAKVEKAYSVDYPDDATKDWRYRRHDLEYREVPIEKIIPGKKLPVLAEWYSGKLRILPEEQFRYRQTFAKSMYAREIVFEIKKGQVVSRIRVSNPREKLYRSPADLEWCASGLEIADKGGWIDARLLEKERLTRLQESGERFRTRGILVPGPPSSKGGAAWLYVCETPMTPGSSIRIHVLPRAKLPSNGAHVEIEGHFVKSQDHYELRVSALRELKPGETMHAPDFPEVWEQLRKEGPIRGAAKSEANAQPK